ncbi:MAG: hypothetical protein M9895_06660 [Aquamicrobium sp.]|uniref:hypothetical protein n=1 Tax=Aquamicrobium sp. TaxID=1872579 RepID=UPI00349EF144|nr:hypothetical protein [Aquamicrobium sp.]
MAARSGFEAWLRAAFACAALALVGTFALPGAALALSELPREDVPVPEGQDGADTIERHDLPPPGQTQRPDAQPPATEEGEETDEDAPEDETQPAGEAPRPPAVTVPLPDPVVIPRDPDRDATQETEGAEADDEPVPEVQYDLSLLPEPVRRMRDLIVEACLSGDIERLRPLLSTGEGATQLSFGAISGDPIAFLRELSGDEEGHEILAILYEVLSAGYVKLGQSAEDEMYVWPYFFAVPLADLNPRQRVELFKIVTAGDYEDMKNYGAYIFYRTGISPEGRWLFFVAGD